MDELDTVIAILKMSKVLEKLNNLPNIIGQLWCQEWSKDILTQTSTFLNYVIDFHI